MPQQLDCPLCRNSMQLVPELAGEMVFCPHCNGQIQMPQLSVPVGPPRAPSRPAAKPPSRRPPASRPAPTAQPPANNPYAAPATQAPATTSGDPTAESRRWAKGRVQGPAIAIMICSMLGVAIGFLIMAIAIRDFTKPPLWKAMFIGKNADLLIAIRGFWSIISIGANGLALYGATQMMSLKSYSAAKTAATMMAIPIFVCLVLGIPISVWSHMTLNDPEVRRAFRGKRRRRR